MGPFAGVAHGLGDIVRHETELLRELSAKYGLPEVQSVVYSYGIDRALALALVLDTPRTGRSYGIYEEEL